MEFNPGNIVEIHWKNGEVENGYVMETPDNKVYIHLPRKEGDLVPFWLDVSEIEDNPDIEKTINITGGSHFIIGYPENEDEDIIFVINFLGISGMQLAHSLKSFINITADEFGITNQKLIEGLNVIEAEETLVKK